MEALLNKNTNLYSIQTKPDYSDMPDSDFYTSDIMWEYKQCLDEGLDIDMYEGLFKSVAALEKGEAKKDFGEAIFKLIKTLPVRGDYGYFEPSKLSEIKKLTSKHGHFEMPKEDVLKEKIHGALLGRVCGCLLGKSVEGARRNELVPFLKKTGNYPLKRYIKRSDFSKKDVEEYSYNFEGAVYVDDVCGMPPDDDTNYTVMAQLVFEKYGKDFTPENIAGAWLKYQPRDAYFTAERTAFNNFLKGFKPPVSAIYQNPYREWIGAQIRADYWGYINPCDPASAAEAAFKDASVSHVKNGIYGEMFVAAMLSAAAAANSVKPVIETGLSQIPYTSRLFEAVKSVIADYEGGVSKDSVFERIHKEYDEHTGYGWCHTIPNAMIVAASLLYGENDYRKSVCMAVETGFDTDCNGATVGSVLGMMLGKGGIPADFSEPLCDTLNTTLFGVGTLKISDCAERTLLHILKNQCK